MNNNEFNGIVDAQFAFCKYLLKSKQDDYANEALDSDDGYDRLRHFVQAGNMQCISAEAAALGMLSKHIVSIVDICYERTEYDEQKVTEKVTDAINYLILIKAILIEKMRDKVQICEELK